MMTFVSKEENFNHFNSSLFIYWPMKNSVKKLKHNAIRTKTLSEIYSNNLFPLEKMLLNEASEQAFRKFDCLNSDLPVADRFIGMSFKFLACEDAE